MFYKPRRSSTCMFLSLQNEELIYLIIAWDVFTCCSVQRDKSSTHQSSSNIWNPIHVLYILPAGLKARTTEGSAVRWTWERLQQLWETIRSAIPHTSTANKKAIYDGRRGRERNGEKEGQRRKDGRQRRRHKQRERGRKNEINRQRGKDRGAERRCDKASEMKEERKINRQRKSDRKNNKMADRDRVVVLGARARWQTEKLNYLNMRISRLHTAQRVLHMILFSDSLWSTKHTEGQTAWSALSHTWQTHKLTLSHISSKVVPLTGTAERIASQCYCQKAWQAA